MEPGERPPWPTGRSRRERASALPPPHSWNLRRLVSCTSGFITHSNSPPLESNVPFCRLCSLSVKRGPISCGVRRGARRAAVEALSVGASGGASAGALPACLPLPPRPQPPAPAADRRQRPSRQASTQQHPTAPTCSRARTVATFSFFPFSFFCRSSKM